MTKHWLLKCLQGLTGSEREDRYEISKKCLRNSEYSICDDFEREFQYWPK